MDLNSVNTVNTLDETLDSSLSLGQQVPTLYELAGAACRQAAKLILSDIDQSTVDFDLCWEQAVHFYQEASESGDLEANFELAWLHLAGAHVEQSNEKAFEYWQRVIHSKADDSILKAISLYMVGVCNQLGVGTEMNLVTGWKLINQSKTVNYEFVLAGQWAFDFDWGKSINETQSSSHVSQVFFERVTSGSDNNSLLKHLEGVCYFYGFGTGKDQSKAVEIFTALANGGFAASQVLLGACYYDGYVVGKGHEATAVEWFQRSVEQGYAWGQSALSCCYYHGRGVPQDNAKVLEWCTKAADQGHAIAQYNCGACYFGGLGVPRDIGKAVMWYRKAADQGVATAKYMLRAYY